MPTFRPTRVTANTTDGFPCLIALAAGTMLCVPALAQVQPPTRELVVPEVHQGVHRRTDGSAILFREFVGAHPVFVGTTNIVSQETISVDHIQPGPVGSPNLTGSGIKVGLWEVGGMPFFSHQELSGRVGLESNPLAAIIAAGQDMTINQHATHVAGTIAAAGLNPLIEGMAPQSTVAAWDAINDVAEMRLEAGLGLRISNHSYAQLCGFDSDPDTGATTWYGDTTVSTAEDYSFGHYNTMSANVDAICWDFPSYLPICAAGNDRNDVAPSAGTPYLIYDPLVATYVPTFAPRLRDGGASGHDTIPGGIQTSKNVLTVGAIMPIPGGFTTSATITSFSSFGPTDDGRIKPDVVCDGYAVTSCDITSTTSTVSKSGTSMASPAAAGTAALLLQQLQRDLPAHASSSATLKGLLIHTADDVLAVGPDYRFGWGVVNARAASEFVTAAASASPSRQILQHVQFPPATSTWDFDCTGGWVRITLCWNDYPGAPMPRALDTRAPRLTTDLDIRLVQTWTSGIVNEYYPFVLNPSSPGAPAATGDNDLDNVEQVLVQVPPSGPNVSYQVVVSTERYRSAFPLQPFSILVSGGRLVE